MKVKGPAGRGRPKQPEFIGWIRDAGGVAFVARDLRDVLSELNQLKGNP